MAENKVKRDNYITIQGFMLTELGLKGNELLVYACIYGFSQTDDQWFTGSRQYLADWTNSTKQSIQKCLNSLVSKGLLEKRENRINGIKFCEYKAINLPLDNKVYWGSQQSLLGGKQSLLGGSQQSLPNNIDINNIDNIIEDNIAATPPQQQIVNMYLSICISYPKLRTMPENRKKAIKARLKKYSINDFKELFEKAEASTWLKSKNFGFDWLITESNMAKVLEGNYDDKPSGKRKELIPSWMTKEQQHYDFGALENELLANKPDLSQRAEDLKRRLGGEQIEQKECRA